MALSAVICYLATACARAWAVPSQSITLITAATVALATAAPRTLAPLAAAGEGLAAILMQVLHAVAVACIRLGQTAVRVHQWRANRGQGALVARALERVAWLA